MAGRDVALGAYELGFLPRGDRNRLIGARVLELREEEHLRARGVARTVDAHTRIVHAIVLRVHRCRRSAHRIARIEDAVVLPGRTRRGRRAVHEAGRYQIRVGLGIRHAAQVEAYSRSSHEDHVLQILVSGLGGQVECGGQRGVCRLPHLLLSEHRSVRDALIRLDARDYALAEHLADEHSGVAAVRGGLGHELRAIRVGGELVVRPAAQQPVDVVGRSAGLVHRRVGADPRTVVRRVDRVGGSDVTPVVHPARGGLRTVLELVGYQPSHHDVRAERAVEVRHRAGHQERRVPGDLELVRRYLTRCGHVQHVVTRDERQRRYNRRQQIQPAARVRQRAFVV